MTEIIDKWFLYLLKCENDYFYAGIAKDVNKRFLCHKNGKGAKFTKINKPLEILRTKEFKSKSEALKAEIELKKISKNKKINYFN